MADEKSDLGITVKKSDDFSEWYTQVIRKAELIEYSPVSGCMVIRPNSYSIWEYAQKYFDEKIKKMGVKNAYFPLLIPESLLKKEQEHVEGFTPEVAWVTTTGDTPLPERLAIRPTSETIMYDAYSKWIRSHKDLPLRLNQWCNVVRWEFKHPTPFLRTREFLWQEGHTVFSNAKDAEEEVRQIVELYAQLFEELYSVPVLVGRKSDTEKFAGAVYSLSIEALLPNGKAIQAGTSHYLGQNFSKAFGISFLNDKSESEFGYQNSWGFTTRSIGIMVGVHSDDKGLVLPPRVAQTQAVIVPIVFSKNPDQAAEVLKGAKKLKNDLEEHGLRVHLDDRDDSSPGFKYNYWELRGIPLRIEIGPKDLEKKSAMVVRRDTGEKKSVELKTIAKESLHLLDTIQHDLLKKAKAFLDSNIKKTETYSELKKTVEAEHIAYTLWCAEPSCEKKVKDDTGAKTLNMPLDQKKAHGECFCGKPAKVHIYFGRSY